MKRLFLCAVLALGLSGCWNPQVQLQTVASQNTLYGLINAYGVTLSAEIAYKSLPLCATGTKATPTNICAQRSVIVRLQAADLKARTAIQNAANFIKTYPTVDATNIISAAQTALAAFQQTAATAGGQ